MLNWGFPQNISAYRKIEVAAAEGAKRPGALCEGSSAHCPELSVLGSLSEAVSLSVFTLLTGTFWLIPIEPDNDEEHHQLPVP